MISIGWVGSHACAGTDITNAPLKQNAATPKAKPEARISLLPLVSLHGRSFRRLGVKSSPLRASYLVQIKSQIADSSIHGCNRLRLLRTEADLLGVFAAQQVSRAPNQQFNHAIPVTLTRRLLLLLQTRECEFRSTWSEPFDPRSQSQFQYSRDCRYGWADGEFDAAGVGKKLNAAECRNRRRKFGCGGRI